MRSPSPRLPRPAATGPSQPARSRRGASAPSSLDLSRGAAQSGDRIDGALRAEPLQDFTASEARVELVRSENFGNTAKDEVVDQVTLERDPSMQSGNAREWRFTLDVGQVSMPSLKTEKSSVRWLVRAVLDRSLRTDPKVEQDIDVGF